MSCQMLCNITSVDSCEKLVENDHILHKYGVQFQAFASPVGAALDHTAGQVVVPKGQRTVTRRSLWLYLDNQVDASEVFAIH